MMKTQLHRLLMIFLLLCSTTTKAAWINVNTGINDNFNSVYFWNVGRVGVLAGDKGLYFTTTGGTSAASWKRFEITQNAQDAERYSHCKFLSVSASEVVSDTNKLYACGWDSVENKAVVLFVNLNNSAYSFQYTGAIGSKLNMIKVVYSSYIYAVGNNGLILRSNMTSFTEIPSGTLKNLLSIDINDNYIAIGGEHVFINGYDSGSFTAYDQPYTFKDVMGKSNHAVGKAFYYTTNNGASFSSAYQYKFGELNGQCMAPSGGYYYVGTSHGIFKANGQPADNLSVLELQPSTVGYFINDLLFLGSPNSVKGYAAGKNGVFLLTKDGGGLPIPFASLNLKGTCTDSKIYLYGNRGTGTSCTWYVNNVIDGTTCEYWQKFKPAGTYKLTYIVKNADGYADTANQTIYIVDPPKINLPVSLSKNRICKIEQVDVTIEGTQKDFLYQFVDKNKNTIGSASGTGQKLVFKVTLSEPGPYFINVKSEIATCEQQFTDTIHVTVEKTKADFRASLINAQPSEAVDFFQRCREAQHYAWTFSNDASSPVDSTGNPAGIKFKILGKSTVKLIAWSNYGCYDTIEKEGPFIYNESAADDSCWAFNLSATDPSWQNYRQDIQNQVLTPDGYLIAGSNFQTIYTSRIGNSFKRGNEGGIYVAKYSRNGVLKWVDYSISPDYNNGNSTNTLLPYVSSMSVSSIDGSIYMTGIMRISDNFYSCTGDTIKLMNNSGFNNFFMKLSADGKKVAWLKSAMEIQNFWPFKVKEDNAGDLLVAAGYTNGGSQIYFMKFDKATGKRKWTFIFEDDNASSYSFRDFDFDARNNIVITGALDYDVTFRSVDGKVERKLVSPDNMGTKLFVVKYDSAGYYKWSMFEHVGSATSSVIVADSAGNMYVTGDNRCSYNGSCFEFTNADNSVYKANVGGYFLMKVDPTGKIVWVNGSKLAYYGYGLGLSLNKDEIAAIGRVSNNPGPWAGIMTSSNGNHLNYSIGMYDLFIASYTTNGVLKSIMNTGPNPQGGTLEYKYSLAKDEEGCYFFAGNIKSYIKPYIIGLSSITTNGIDGVMAKMSKSGCNTIVVTAVENIKNTVPSPDADIFPNPANDQVLITLKNTQEEYDLKIYNPLGACVYSKHVSGSSLRLNKKEWSDGSGLYIIRLQFRDRTADFSKKLMVIE